MQRQRLNLQNLEQSSRFYLHRQVRGFHAPFRIS